MIIRFNLQKYSANKNKTIHMNDTRKNYYKDERNGTGMARIL